jgi:aminoglycoside 6-adenylyltransferase
VGALVRAKAIPPDAEAVLGRGFSIVYDELDLAALEPTTVASTPPPTQAGLEQLSNDFWHHVLWVAKKLRRGELLLAKQACDCYLTSKVVELARWGASDRDTWHGYRFFERWADEALPDGLRPTFARYDAADIDRALHAKGELFGQLEHQIAQRFRFVEPVDRSEVLRRLDLLLTR